MSNPLIRDLQQRAEAGASLDSDAKRHHFIPRFLLREFATEEGNRYLLHQLDRTNGRCHRVTIEAAASRHRFYTVRDEDGSSHNQIEGYLALVESHAAPADETVLGGP